MCVLRALLAAVLWGSWLPCQISGPGSPELQDRARQVLAAADCQTELPGTEPAEAGAEPSRLSRRGGKVLPREARDRQRLPYVPWCGGEVLLWGVIAGAVLGLVVLIARGARSLGEGRGRTTPVSGAAGPEAAAAVAELPDHARLAQQGQFAAAVHALLRHAFAALSRAGNALPEHATGRALLARAASGSLPTEGLARLVQSVELLHFGGRPARAEHYQESLRSYEQWEAACRKQR
jgi:hypothetical protein